MGWLILFVIALAIFVALAQRPYRCPNCTQLQYHPRWSQDVSCRACGTPILRGGQFVRKEDTGRA